MNVATDQKERQILLKAPRSRVWRALANSGEFGRLFGVAFDDGAFTVGQRVRGHVAYPGYEHVIFEVVIERLEAEQCSSWRWLRPLLNGASTTPKGPQEADGGTLLSVVESGFDNLPPQRRLAAFRMSSNGWDEQMQSMRAHVATP